MAETDGQKKSFPYISANVWNELRLRFQKSVPTKITTSYLQTALGFATEKAAKNLLPQLRTVGLIDAKDAPTDLAKHYRIDSEYAKSVKEIVEAVYPEELRDLFPGPSEDSAEVASWFMRHTGGGQAASGMQARFYLQLISGELPVVSSSRKTNGGDMPKSPAKTRVKKSTSTRVAAAAASDSQTSMPNETQPEPRPARPNGSSPTQGRPNLHIDVQVHISADASTSQIDAVFESMAKHLYGNE